jgi:hypothetical protein
MTLAEITAKLNELLGLKDKVTALETGSATAAQLTAETEARKASESKVTALEAELAKVKAAAPPVKDEPAPDHSAAIEALEKAITVLKATAPAPEKDDKETEDDAKAEGDADSADDAEAKECMAKKNFAQVKAVRQRQLERKSAYVPKMIKKVNAITTKKAVTAEIARLGIPMPLATRKDGKNPLLAEKSSRGRAHKLTASGFNDQPAVAALNISLGRVVRN